MAGPDCVSVVSAAPWRRGGAAGEGGPGRHRALRGRQPQLRCQVGGGTTSILSISLYEVDDNSQYSWTFHSTQTNQLITAGAGFMNFRKLKLKK